MTDFEIYRNSPEIESVKLSILLKAEKPLKPVWPFASFLIPWKKLGNLGMFYGLYKTLDKTYDSTSENRKRLLPKGQAGLKIAAKYLIKKLPGYLLKPLMEGSKLERQLSNTGLLSVLALRLNTLNASTIERAVIDKVLREKFADQLHVDYNDFRKAVLDELITYSRVPLTKFEDYGIDRLKYSEPMDPAGLSIDGYKDIDRLNTFTFESPRIPYGNTRHYPGSTLGHVRTFTTREDPHTLYILENQSDWGLNKFKDPMYLTSEQEFIHDNNILRRLGRYVPDRFKAEYRKLIKDRERYGSNFPENVIDLYSEEFINFIDDNLWLRAHTPTGDVIAKWNKKYSPINQQIKYLHDNYSQRQLQESLKYASENGLTKMRYPTRETAAKIEGYSKESLTPEYIAAVDELRRLSVQDGNLAPVPDEINIFADNPTEIIYYTPEKRAELLRDAENRVAELEIALKDRTYLPEHQTILRKYSEFPKLFKKLYNDQEVRTVTDSKGNTWYEVDVPNGYLQREWPFKHGGKIKKHLINK